MTTQAAQCRMYSIFADGTKFQRNLPYIYYCYFLFHLLFQGVVNGGTIAKARNVSMLQKLTILAGFLIIMAM